MTGIPLFGNVPKGSNRERKQSPIKPCHHGTGHPRVGKPAKRHPPSGGRGGESHTPGCPAPYPKHDTKGRWPKRSEVGGRFQFFPSPIFFGHLLSSAVILIRLQSS